MQNDRYFNRLKDLREDKDLTQDQLVKILQMNKTTYTRYEQGITDIPLEFAKRMSAYYNVSIDYIAGLIDTPRKLNGKSHTAKSYTITQNGNNITNHFD